MVVDVAEIRNCIPIAAAFYHIDRLRRGGDLSQGRTEEIVRVDDVTAQWSGRWLAIVQAVAAAVCDPLAMRVGIGWADIELGPAAVLAGDIGQDLIEWRAVVD